MQLIANTLLRLLNLAAGTLVRLLRLSSFIVDEPLKTLVAKNGYRENVAQLDMGLAVAPDVAAGTPLSLENAFSAHLEEVTRCYNHQNNPSVATRELLAQAAIRKAAIILQHLTTLYPHVMVPQDVMDAIQLLIHNEIQQSEQRIHSEIQHLRGEVQRSEQHLHDEVQRSEQRIHSEIQHLRDEVQRSEQHLHDEVQRSEQHLHDEVQRSEQHRHDEVQQSEQRICDQLHLLVLEQGKTNAHLHNIRAAAFNANIFNTFETISQAHRLQPFVKMNEGLENALPGVPGPAVHLPIVQIGDPVPAAFFPLTPAVLREWTHGQISALSMLMNEDFGIERGDDIELRRHKVKRYLVSP